MIIYTHIYIYIQRYIYIAQIFHICYSNHNLGHNMLELYNVLIQTRLTTSKTKRDV